MDERATIHGDDPKAIDKAMVLACIRWAEGDVARGLDLYLGLSHGLALAYLDPEILPVLVRAQWRSMAETNDCLLAAVERAARHDSDVLLRAIAQWEARDA